MCNTNNFFFFNQVPYLSMLTEALGNEDQKTEVRMLAGIALKNQITAKVSINCNCVFFYYSNITTNKLSGY